jgi:type IV pilus assembly protein PilM
MQSLIGIDIGNNSVKVVRFEQKPKLTLTHAFMFPTPHDFSNGGKIDPKIFLQHINASLSKSDLRFSEVALNIPSSRTTVLVTELPKMTKKELEIAAVAEARKKMVPTPGPDSIFEYLMLEDVMTGKVPRFEVLIIKTEKKIIEDNLHIFDGADNLAPALLTPTCYSVTNLLDKNSPATNQNTAFVDVGHESIDVTITKKGKLHFYRNIKFGLKDVFSHMSVNLGLTPAAVEKIIREHGVPEIDIDLKDKVKVAEEIMRQKYEASLKGVAETEVNLIELRMLWDAEIERLINEIRRSLIYYGEQTHGSRVDAIYLLGGGSGVKGLAPVLKRSFSGLQVVDAFAGADVTEIMARQNDLLACQGSYACASSLALSVLLSQKKRDGIDFLPEDIHKQKISLRRQVSIALVSVVVLAIVFLSWLKVYMDNNIIYGRLKKLEQEVVKSQNVITMLEGAEQEKTSIDERLNEAQAVLAKRVDVEALLLDVSAMVPRDITFKSMVVTSSTAAASVAAPSSNSRSARNKQPRRQLKYVVNIEAFCREDYENAVISIKSFAKMLEDSVLFDNVAIMLPPLEAMRPQDSGSGGLSLTREQVRDFSITMDVADKSKS